MTFLLIAIGSISEPPFFLCVVVTIGIASFMDNIIDYAEQLFESITSKVFWIIVRIVHAFEITWLAF